MVSKTQKTNRNVINNNKSVHLSFSCVKDKPNKDNIIIIIK